MDEHERARQMFAEQVRKDTNLLPAQADAAAKRILGDNSGLPNATDKEEMDAFLNSMIGGWD